MKDKIPYSLKNPITVHSGGDLKEVLLVDLTAPSKKLIRKTYPLQQYIARAIIQGREVARNSGSTETPGDTKEDIEVTGSQIMMILLLSDVPIEECLNQFKKLALSGAVEVEGNIINSIQWDKLDPEDEEGLFAEYVANFILYLVMKNL